METYILQRGSHLEEGGGRLKAHMGNRDPFVAGQMGVARADAGEGCEGQDPRSQRWVGSVRPVHLIRVAEGPPPGQRIHDLQEAVSEPGAQAPGELPTAPPFHEAHLGHLAGFRRLGALEGGRLLAGQLQFPLARGLEPAIVHAAVVQTAALPVLPLAFPVATDAEPLGRAPVKQTREGAT